MVTPPAGVSAADMTSGVSFHQRMQQRIRPQSGDVSGISYVGEAHDGFYSRGSDAFLELYDSR